MILRTKTAKRLEEIDKILPESSGFTRSLLLTERTVIISEKNELKKIWKRQHDKLQDTSTDQLLRDFASQVGNLIQEIESVEKQQTI